GGGLGLYNSQKDKPVYASQKGVSTGGDHDTVRWEKVIEDDKWGEVKVELEFDDLGAAIKFKKDEVIDKGQLIGIASMVEGEKDHSYISVRMKINGRKVPLPLSIMLNEYEAGLDVGFGKYLDLIIPLAKDFNAFEDNEDTLAYQLIKMAVRLRELEREGEDLKYVEEEYAHKRMAEIANQQAAIFGALKMLGRLDASDDFALNIERIIEEFAKLVEKGPGAKLDLNFAYPYAPSNAIIPSLRIGDASMYLSVHGSQSTYYFNMIGQFLAVDRFADMGWIEQHLTGVSLPDAVLDVYSMFRMWQHDFSEKGGTTMLPKESFYNLKRLLFDRNVNIPWDGSNPYWTWSFMPQKLFEDLSAIVNRVLSKVIPFVPDYEDHNWAVVKPKLPSVYNYGHDENDFMWEAVNNNTYRYLILRGISGEMITVKGKEVDSSKFVATLRIDPWAKNEEGKVLQYTLSQRYPVYEGVSTNDPFFKSMDDYLAPGGVYTVPSIDTLESLKKVPDMMRNRESFTRSQITGKVSDKGSTEFGHGLNARPQIVLAGEGAITYLNRIGIVLVNCMETEGRYYDGKWIHPIIEPTLKSMTKDYWLWNKDEGENHVADLLKFTRVAENVKSGALARLWDDEKKPVEKEAIFYNEEVETKSEKLSEIKRELRRIEDIELFEDRLEYGERVRVNSMMPIQMIDGSRVFYNTRDFIDAAMLATVYETLGSRVSGVAGVVIDVTGLFKDDAAVVTIGDKSVLVLNPGLLYETHSFRWANKEVEDNLKGITVAKVNMDDETGLKAGLPKTRGVLAKAENQNQWNTMSKVLNDVIREGSTTILPRTQKVLVDEDNDPDTIAVMIEKKDVKQIRLMLTEKSFYFDTFEDLWGYLTKTLRLDQFVKVTYTTGEMPLYIRKERGYKSPSLIVGGEGIDFDKNEIGLVEFGANAPDIEQMIEDAVAKNKEIAGAVFDRKTNALERYFKEGEVPLMFVL
ncbi:MAG: hypothetical protein KAR31_02735, partial [Candidatus Omnitrophica bacterium]|nr:hypothetical protein [Candidatus Omnitrophota bacterium]